MWRIKVLTFVSRAYHVNLAYKRYPDKMPKNVHGQNARKWKTGQNAGTVGEARHLLITFWFYRKFNQNQWHSQGVCRPGRISDLPTHWNFSMLMPKIFHDFFLEIWMIMILFFTPKSFPPFFCIIFPTINIFLVSKEFSPSQIFKCRWNFAAAPITPPPPPCYATDQNIIKM